MFNNKTILAIIAIFIIVLAFTALSSDTSVLRLIESAGACA
ncbi:MAG: hypothetical protein WCK67_12630 [bacterium]